jgi:hypothetical protein
MCGKSAQIIWVTRKSDKPRGLKCQIHPVPSLAAGHLLLANDTGGVGRTEPNSNVVVQINDRAFYFLVKVTESGL